MVLVQSFPIIDLIVQSFILFKTKKVQIPVGNISALAVGFKSSALVNRHQQRLTTHPDRE